jgi:hypothetical protein
MEGLLVVRTKHLVHRLLYDSIDHIRNTKPTLPTARFRNPHTPDVSGLVAPVQQAAVQH